MSDEEIETVLLLKYGDINEAWDSWMMSEGDPLFDHPDIEEYMRDIMFMKGGWHRESE